MLREILRATKFLLLCKVRFAHAIKSHARGKNRAHSRLFREVRSRNFMVVQRLLLATRALVISTIIAKQDM